MQEIENLKVEITKNEELKKVAESRGDDANLSRLEDLIEKQNFKKLLLTSKSITLKVLIELLQNKGAT